MMAVPGLYVAHHPSLGASRKVGHTCDLRRRLHDDAYVTCFTPEWYYEFTFETATKEAAQELESNLLEFLAPHIKLPKEIVHINLESVLDAAHQAAALLDVPVTVRHAPVYPRPPGRESDARQARASTGRRVAHLIKPLIREPEPTVLDSGLNDMLGLFEGLTIAPQPAVETTKPTEDPVLKILAQIKTPAVPSPARPAAVTDDDDDLGGLDDLDLGEKLPDYVPVVLRDYQRAAVEAVEKHFDTGPSCVLQMACRTGKTPVACDIIARALDRDPAGTRVLYLVPSLQLLRQTAQKLHGYMSGKWHMILVGSDPKPVQFAMHHADGRVTTTEISMSTNPQLMSADPVGGVIVVSTYKSSNQIPLNWATLTVFDECHRTTCNNPLKDEKNRRFQLHLTGGKGRRLFMTATPVTSGHISMSNKSLYGPTVYRYHLQAGIAANHVNPYRLELVAGPPRILRTPEWIESMAQRICEALGHVEKLLVFCNVKVVAEQLLEAVRRQRAPRDEALGAQGGIDLLCCHSGHSSAEQVRVIRLFNKPGHRSAMFSCKLFQEGVEVPHLNGVFFAESRGSPRDIVQSLCRPLNHLEGKPESVVFIPVDHNPAEPYNSPANLDRFEPLVKFADALMDEDPRLYEFLLNPSHTALSVRTMWAGPPINEVGWNMLRRMLLSTMRMAVNKNNRLVKSENIPWKAKFEEIRRIVLTHNRYPKRHEAWEYMSHGIEIGPMYVAIREAYVAGTLSPSEIADVESLPYWKQWGYDGPYPFKECMTWLTNWLDTHNGVLPLITINAENIEFNATMYERLGGLYRFINQGRYIKRNNGNLISYEPTQPGSKKKKDELDQFCAKYGLRWRKVYHPVTGLQDNSKLPFYKESTNRFDLYYEKHGHNNLFVQTMYPGYPKKYQQHKKNQTTDELD